MALKILYKKATKHKLAKGRTTAITMESLILSLCIIAISGGHMLQDDVWCEHVSEAMSHAAEKLTVAAGLHLRSFLLGESIDYKGFKGNTVHYKKVLNDISCVLIGPYKDWVDDNLDPTYDGYTAYENFIDTMQANGEIDARTALEVYRNCMTGEADFFGSAYA